MARDFPGTQTDYYYRPGGWFMEKLAGASAISCFAWVQFDATSGSNDDSNRIISAFIEANSGLFFLSVQTNVSAGGRVRMAARSQPGETTYSVAGAQDMPASNVWQAVGGYVDFAGKSVGVYGPGDTLATAAAAFLNNTFVPGSLTGIEPDQIGNRKLTSTAFAFNGRICHVAVWKRRLTATEFSLLSFALSPLDLFPLDLVAYWPMTGVNPLSEPDYGPHNSPLQIAGTVPPFRDTAPPFGLSYQEEAGFESIGLSGSTFDESISVAVDVDMSTAGGLLLEGSISLPASLGYAAAQSKTSEGSIALGVSQGMAVDAAGSTWHNTLAIGVDVDYQNSGGQVLEESVSFPVDVDFAAAPASGSTYNESVTFSTTVGVSTSAAGVLESGVQIDTDVGMVAETGGSTYDVGVTVGTTFSVGLQAVRVSEGQVFVESTPEQLIGRRRR